MELYYGKGACSMAPHIALQEAGLNYKLHSLDLAKGEQKSPEFLKINPKGYVPTLKTNEGVFTEAAVILQWIADQTPEKKLFPTSGSTERYHALEWLNFVATEMHKGLGAFFKLRTFTDPHVQQAVRESYLAGMKPRFELLNKRLSESTFLLGEQFSVADAYLFTVMNWTKFHMIDLKPWPKLMGYMEKVGSRSSVRTALKEEGIA